MDFLWSEDRYYEDEDDLALYLKTAGTVLLGWIIVSSMWQILIVLFAPMMVSAIAVFLVSPNSLDWVTRQISPTVKMTACTLLEKVVERLDLTTNAMRMPMVQFK